MSGSNSQTNRAPKRHFPIWFIVLVVVFLSLAFFGDRGILHVLRANQQLDHLETQLRDMEQVNTELRRDIDALRNDLQTIESLARRELGMVRDDERVYQFPPEDQHFQSSLPVANDRSQSR
jgi:cell division protein FtsB